MSPTSEVVGRESEIDSVHGFLEAVPGGPVALLIEGEAGIGKTTLWREGIAEAGERGLQVLTSRPVEAEIALPFAVLGDLLGDVPDAALGRLPDPQREALEVALLRAGAKPGGLQRRAVALGVLGAIRVLAEDTPLVVAIDDAQWLDPPSADALAFAARRLRDEPIGFLLARRAEASEESRVELETALDADRLTRLVIGPLDIRSLDRLLRAQLGRQFLRPALVELQRVSGGNPFFALELGRALLTRDVSPAPGEPLPVPATLNELVRERLAGIPTAAREAALVVSALSRPTVELVAAAAGGGGGTAALEKAAAAGVLEVADGRVRFSHPLLASVVYAQTPPARRRELHARLAEIVDDPDEQALHLALAASGPDAQVAATVEDAARRARARGAPQAAAELWDRARMLTPPDDADAWRRAIEAGECHLEAGDTDRARRLLEEVVARLPAGRERAVALTRLAWVSGFGHGFHVSADLFRDASQRSETILRRASRSNGDSHGASTRPVTSRRPSLMRVRRSSSPSVSGSPACSQAHWRTWPSSRPFAGEGFQPRSSSAPSSSKTRKTSGGRSSDASDPPGFTGCCSSGQAISMLLVRRSLRFATPCSRAATGA